MRLINAQTLELKEFNESTVPKYAILSHTWKDGEEVVYKDMESLSNRPTTRPGYSKIVETCRLARRENLQYAWVDTCCIDKSSSAELTESINSMYKWYKNATICFVYLPDISKDWKDIGFEAAIRQCRWTSRGWTLQELIAPEKVRFHDEGWHKIGSKDKYTAALSRVTLIPLEVLSGQYGLDQYSVAEKMSWAAKRETTRTEDMAYCLLGIFDINMPLIYGEGSKAFFRLQEEIARHDNDPTIFAWDASSSGNDFCSAFAPSPAVFVNSKNIQALSKATFNFDFTLTNKGLRLEVPLLQRNEANATDYHLLVGSKHSSNDAGLVAISLRVAGANVLFRRALPLLGLGDQEVLSDVTGGGFTYFVDNRPSKPPEYYQELLKEFRVDAVYVTTQRNASVQGCSPMTFWDAADRCFFDCHIHGVIYSAVASATVEGVNIDFLIMFSNVIKDRKARIVRQKDCTELAEHLRRHGSKDSLLKWSDVEKEFPILSNLSEQTRGDVNGRSYLATVEVKMRPDRTYVADFQVRSEGDSSLTPMSQMQIRGRW